MCKLCKPCNMLCGSMCYSIRIQVHDWVCFSVKCCACTFIIAPIVAVLFVFLLQDYLKRGVADIMHDNLRINIINPM